MSVLTSPLLKHFLNKRHEKINYELWNITYRHEVFYPHLNTDETSILLIDIFYFHSINSCLLFYLQYLSPLSSIDYDFVFCLLLILYTSSVCLSLLKDISLLLIVYNYIYFPTKISHIFPNLIK